MNISIVKIKNIRTSSFCFHWTRFKIHFMVIQYVCEIILLKYSIDIFKLNNSINL